MAYQDDLLAFAQAALPQWFTSEERTQEDLHAFAEILAGAWETVAYWVEMASLGGATGASPGLPDWLQEHARDRGTRRQTGETDAALSARLRVPEDVATRVAILARVNAVLAAAGFGTATLVESLLEGAYGSGRDLDGGADLIDPWASGYEESWYPDGEAFEGLRCEGPAFVVYLPSAAASLVPSIEEVVRQLRAAGVDGAVAVMA